jgi:hypothetical protein
MRVYDPALLAALDRLDEVFAGQPATFEVTGCGACYSEADLVSLTGPPDLVTDDMVSHVVSETPSHWSDFPGLFHRMAPRILQLLVQGELHTDEGTIGERFAQAQWMSWPQDQRDAVKDVLTAWWRVSLTTYPASLRIHGVLEVLILATRQVEPWLQLWEPGVAASMHLADLWRWWFFYLGDEVNIGVNQPYDATDEVLTWLSGHAHSILAELPDLAEAEDVLSELAIARTLR